MVNGEDLPAAPVLVVQDGNCLGGGGVGGGGGGSAGGGVLVAWPSYILDSLVE